MEQPTDFSGKWRLTRNENFEEYYAAMGMPWLARQVASRVTPEMDVTQSADRFKTDVKTLVFTYTSDFEYDKEFIAEPPDCGQKMRSIGRWEGGKIVVDATPEKPEESNIISQTSIRELSATNETLITSILKCKDDPEKEVTMKRYWSKIE